MVVITTKSRNTTYVSEILGNNHNGNTIAVAVRVNSSISCCHNLFQCLCSKSLNILRYIISFIVKYKTCCVCCVVLVFCKTVCLRRKVTKYSSFIIFKNLRYMTIFIVKHKTCWVADDISDCLHGCLFKKQGLQIQFILLSLKKLFSYHAGFSYWAQQCHTRGFVLYREPPSGNEIIPLHFRSEWVFK